jgi:hypothetical protein
MQDLASLLIARGLADIGVLTRSDAQSLELPTIDIAGLVRLEVEARIPEIVAAVRARIEGTSLP